MGRERSYTSAQALVDLGGKPSDDEIKRLIENYPSYQYLHRWELLHGMFDGKSHEELVLGKMTAKGLDTSISKQSKGAHGRWVVAKIRKAVIRLLYLRYRLDKKMTRRKANQEIIKQFKFWEEAKDFGQSSIRKDTRSLKIDGSLSL